MIDNDLEMIILMMMCKLRDIGEPRFWMQIF